MLPSPASRLGYSSGSSTISRSEHTASLSPPTLSNPGASAPQLAPVPGPCNDEGPPAARAIKSATGHSRRPFTSSAGQQTASGQGTAALTRPADAQQKARPACNSTANARPTCSSVPVLSAPQHNGLQARCVLGQASRLLGSKLRLVFVFEGSRQATRAMTRASRAAPSGSGSSRCTLVLMLLLQQGQGLVCLLEVSRGSFQVVAAQTTLLATEPPAAGSRRPLHRSCATPQHNICFTAGKPHTCPGCTALWQGIALSLRLPLATSKIVHHAPRNHNLTLGEIEGMPCASCQAAEGAALRQGTTSGRRTLGDGINVALSC